MMGDLTIFGLIWRVGLLALLIGIGAIFGRGWSVLSSAETSPEDRPPLWQLFAFMAGLALIGLAFISPLEKLVGEFFWVRVIQHILITGVIPLFLLVANPYPTLKIGLPSATRAKLSQFKQQRSHWRNAITQLTSPGLIWGTFVVNFWLWHDETLIEAARTIGWVHFLEVITLLGTSCLYWWHIASAAPRLHRPMPPVVRMLYAFAGMLPIKILGMVLLFGNETVVGGYVVHDSADLVQVGGLALADKSLGAILIWVVGGVTYTYAATFLAGRYVGTEEAKPVLPVSVLEQDDLWVLPGIGAGKERPPHIPPKRL